MRDSTSFLSQTKLYVGGLDRKLRGKDLREAFSKFGEIAFARVKLEEETNRSKGFGFVEFSNPEDAIHAQKEMDGKEIMGRIVKVDFAKENSERSPSLIAGISSSPTHIHNKDQTIQQMMGH